MKFLLLDQCSIYEQLKLEEYLLRNRDDNWCLVNTGSSPAIVMGISGKPLELIHKEKIVQAPVPVIKRFSGGGTVVVDEDTLFVTFIFQKDAHSFPGYPEPIYRWAEEFFINAWNIPDFSLRDNDFAIADRKCGGNAQYLKKDRWLQHTSFLWDYCPEKMSYLLHPRKTPAYRKERKHEEFLCKMKDYLPSKNAFVEGIIQELNRRYPTEKIDLDQLSPTSNERQSTSLLNELSLFTIC